MDKERVELKVLGIAASQVKEGMFALLLEEVNGGRRRIPVVIGAPEAHSIAIQLENISPPRPLTHDVLCNIIEAYDLRVEEVMIYKYQDNIFFAKLLLTQGDLRRTVDSRTSDAVAIALRTGCPIYISREIIDQTGVIFERVQEDIFEEAPLPQTMNKKSEEELLKELRHAIKHEAYERAAEITNELNKRKQANT